MRPIRGLLIDLDGTVTQAGALIPGAAAAIAELRERGIPFLFTTNTSRKSRRAVTGSLRDLGLELTEGEVFTAPVAAAGWLERQGLRRVQLLVPDSTREDFAAFEVTEEEPEAVLVGDLGEGFTFERLDRAFRSLCGGAQLVAIQKNRFWLTEKGPTLDAGPFVAALEYAAATEAVLVGKPSPAFFQTAAAGLGVAPEELAVVGDDPESDVRGAREAGLVTVQVRTGKGDPSLGGAAGEADLSVPSLARLPEALP